MTKPIVPRQSNSRNGYPWPTTWNVWDRLVLAGCWFTLGLFAGWVLECA